MPYLDGEKTVLQSQTIRAIIVAVLLVLGSLGIDWANLWDDERINKLVEGISAAAVVVTLLMAAKGRVNATEKIVKPDPRETP
jgi:type II secretory pathway component PulL